jgi:hypothetical protein
MELTNILIWAIMGALAVLVVTGGLMTMNDTEPTTGVLAAGAGVGAGIGAAFAHYAGGEASKVLETVMSGGGGGEPTMKVGLPGF